MSPIQQWITVVRAALHQGASADSEITLVVPAAGVKQMGTGTMAGPSRRAAVTDTATEALKNAWSWARAMDLTDTPASPHPPRPDPPHVPWCPGSEGGNTFKDASERAANDTDGAAETGVGTVGSLEEEYSVDTERSTPPSLSEY